MNDYLPQAETSRQRTRPPVASVFDEVFSTAPDLSGMTFASRRVLVAAATLFSEFGAAGTSVRDIAKACGVSPGAFYKHFGSRDDVLYRLVDHGHTRIETRVAAALAATPKGTVERLSAFVHAYVMAHLTNPELANLVRREYVHLSPERLAAIVERRRAMRSQLTALLKKGSRSGDFDLPAGRGKATRTAIMILDMCSRTSDWYDPYRTPTERPERLAAHYVDAALRLAGGPA